MDQLVLKLGGYQGAKSVHTRAAVRFGEVLERETGGRVGFELIPDVIAIGRRSGDLPTMVEAGELALCYIATVRFSHDVPELRMFELPFVVRDREATMNALDGALGERLSESMQARTPYRALGFWDNGFRHFTNKVRPIRTPADCKGLRIRTQLSDLLGESMSALGFVPVPTDIKEFLERIAGNRFDAQENPLTNTYNFGMHKHHRYITMSGHFFGASAFVCNKVQYAAWPREVQQAVETAAREATALQHKLAAEEDDEILAKIDPKENEIIRLTPAERAAFVKAVEPVLERHRKDLDPRLFDYLR